MFGLDNDRLMRLLYLVLLLVFVAGGIGFRRGLRGARFQQLFAWAAIALALVTIYAYREPLLRLAEPVIGELTPSRVAIVGSGDTQELAIRRGEDGHFHVDAEVDGTTVRFLIDTGASSTTLTERDARRVGIDLAALRYDRPVQTANGMAMSASARADALQIGPFRLANPHLEVMPDTALDSSLLGMSAINQFRGWRIEDDRLLLSP